MLDLPLHSTSHPSLGRVESTNLWLHVSADLPHGFAMVIIQKGVFFSVWIDCWGRWLDRTLWLNSPGCVEHPPFRVVYLCTKLVIFSIQVSLPESIAGDPSSFRPQRHQDYGQFGP